MNSLAILKFNFSANLDVIALLVAPPSSSAYVRVLAVWLLTTMGTMSLNMDPDILDPASQNEVGRKTLTPCIKVEWLPSHFVHLRSNEQLFAVCPLLKHLMQMKLS